MKTSVARVIALLGVGLLVSACSEFYSVAPRSLIKTANNYNILSTTVLMATDKTLSDHLSSYNSGKDCSTVRLEQGRTYCREDEPNPLPIMHCYPTLGDVVCYKQPDPSRAPGDRIDIAQPIAPPGELNPQQN